MDVLNGMAGQIVFTQQVVAFIDSLFLKVHWSTGDDYNLLFLKEKLQGKILFKTSSSTTFWIKDVLIFK